MSSTILNDVVGGDLKPARKGGITLYPAASLEKIFDWAEGAGRTLEWVEGVFYQPDTNEGQLSLSYICERQGAEYDAFRQTCLSLVDEIEAEGAAKQMGAYFEIGISD